MGQQASKPRSGVKLQVIGAGLSRTGTTSFTKALEILLDGPVYHGGTQSTIGPESETKAWLRALKLWHSKPQTEPEIRKIIAARLEGFAAVSDAPAFMFTPEIVDLFPDAKVICTVRDAHSWGKSMEGFTSNIVQLWFLRFALFLLPSLRYFPALADALGDVWKALYGLEDPPGLKSYNRHIEWLKETVPADRLIFFDVRDGWGPLCEVLGKPIPNEPFPRINDAKATEDFVKMHVQRGLTRWLAAFGIVTFMIVVYRSA